MPKFKLLILTLFCCFFLSCGSSAPIAGNSGIDVSGFPGVKKIEKTGDRTWRISWDPVPDSSVLYGIFIGKRNEPIDYSSAPLATTRQNFYEWSRTDIFSGINYCLSVRVINMVGDENKNFLCTEDSAYVFNGLESMERQSDGSWILKWTEIPVSGAIFQIFERDAETTPIHNFDLASYFGIKENFFKLPVIERGVSNCYVVRYILESAPEDTNETELCTPNEEEFQFDGIQSAAIEGATSARISWNKSTNDFVTGYKVYQGSEFTEFLFKVDADTTAAVIESLIPGRQYAFGVRVVDEYGREDGNFRNLSVVVPRNSE